MTNDEEKVDLSKEDLEGIGQILERFEGETLKHFVIKEQIDSDDGNEANHGLLRQ